MRTTTDFTAEGNKELTDFNSSTAVCVNTFDCFSYDLS